MKIQNMLRNFSAAVVLATAALVATSFVPQQQASAASIVYDSFYNDLARGSIDIDTDTFYCMLVTASYTPNKGVHNRRDDVSNEVVGTGYTAGGQACTLSITLDTTNHRLDIGITVPNWTSSTITARALVVYKRRGGASSADELCYYIDFLADITSTASTFSFNLTAPFRIQN